MGLVRKLKSSTSLVLGSGSPTEADPIQQMLDQALIQKLSNALKKSGRRRAALLAPFAGRQTNQLNSSYTNMQVLKYDPKGGIALPIPNWMDVVKNDGNEIVVEGTPPQPISVYGTTETVKDFKVRLVFKIDSDGGLNRLCNRRTQGIWPERKWDSTTQKYVTTGKLKMHRSGNLVLTSRILSYLVNNHKGRWW